MRREELLTQIAATAPEITAGYAEIRSVIESDGALPASTKALLVAASAAARGYDGLARDELARGRAVGLSERDIADAGVSLLLARGEVICRCFADAAGVLEPAPRPRPPSPLGAVDYFLDFFGVDELPVRMSIMSRQVPTVFSGYQRMHHATLKADPASGKLTELVLVAVNAADLASRFVGIHAATARTAGAADAELVEAVVCAIPVSGVAAWASAAEALFPDE
jgi:4-carboxymuconolactone decarboxylase